MKSIKDYILEQVKNTLVYDYREINESGGLYDGQLDLASFLCDTLENEINKSKHKDKLEFIYNYEDLNFNNVFFDKLVFIYHIERNRKNLLGDSNFLYYDSTDQYTKFNYNNDTNRLKQINIELYFNNKIQEEYDKIRGRICHELNHCYTYYEIISDDLNETDDIKIVPDEYNSILHKWKDESYLKIVKDINNRDDLAKRWSSLLIYSLTRYERNAFLAEIDSYIFNRRGNKLKNTNNVEIELAKCPQYNVYIDETYRILDIIKNEWNDEQKDILVKLYNDIYHTNKNFNKIIWILKSKTDYTIKKLNKNIKKLTLEYKSIHENMQGPVYEGYLSYFENPMDKYIEWF